MNIQAMYNEQSTLIQFLLIGRCHHRHTYTKRKWTRIVFISTLTAKGIDRLDVRVWPVPGCLMQFGKCETRGRRRAQTRYSWVQAGARVAPHRGPVEIPGSDSRLLLDKMKDGSRWLWNSQRTSLRHSNDDHQRRTPRAMATPFFSDNSNPTPA